MEKISEALFQKLKQAESTRKLDLSNCRLSEDLPQELFQLKGLRSLNLYRNQLKQLPEQIRELDSLNELNLYRNLLSTLPVGIAALKQLTVLNLGSNRLSELPVELFQCVSIEELDLSNNSLSSIPPGIRTMIHLRDLKLFRNKITFLPSEIGNLKSLKKIDLNHNLLTTLPPAMGILTSLIVLDVSDNPLSSPPIYICNRGSIAIINYLKDQLKDETSAMFCVAEGNSLHKAVSNESAKILIRSRNSSNEERYEGGDTFQVVLKGPSATPIVAHVSDMQDGILYYFFSKREGTYEAIYTAEVSGPYSIEITLGGTHISGSPFFLQVEPGEVSATSTTATGSGLTGGFAGHDSSFTIESRDKAGNLQKLGGCPFRVSIKAPHQSFNGTVTDQNNGLYEVKYIPKESGIHKISVTLHDMHISGSPFSVSIAPGSDLLSNMSKSSSSSLSQEDIHQLKLQLDSEMKGRESVEHINRELEGKIVKLKQKLKKKKVDFTQLESELKKTKEELASTKHEFELLKKEKDHLDTESKMSDEIKVWKKNLEEKLNETKKQLETEIESRSSLEHVLQQMRKELEEEVKARSDLEDVRRSLEAESIDLKKKIKEMEDLKATLDEESTVRDEWKNQLEQEQQQLLKLLTDENRQEIDTKLSDVRRELEEEAKARIDLESSKKLVRVETAELVQMLSDVEESKARLDFETKNAQEVDVWKTKIEKEARLRLNMEKLKERLEVQALQVKRKLEIETTTRKMLEVRLSELQSQLDKKQNDYQEMDQLKKLIENEAKVRADLESSKKQLEQEFDALKKQLEKQGILTTTPTAIPNDSKAQSSNDSPKKESQRMNLRASGNRGGSIKNRDELDPAKLSFKEKLGFWSTLKV